MLISDLKRFIAKKFDIESDGFLFDLLIVRQFFGPLAPPCVFFFFLSYPESVRYFVDDWSVRGEVLVAGLDLGVLLEVALGSQMVGDLGGKVQS